MGVRFVLACLASCAAAFGAAAQDKPPAKPESVVKDLYYLEMTLQEADPEKYFTADLAKALKAPGAAAYDYRFDSKDSDAGGLEFTTETVSDTSGAIRASFVRSDRKPTKVLYVVCKREDGSWRIKDAAVPGKWTLRSKLSLPAADAAPGC